MNTPLKFVFNEAKAVEALAYIASRQAGLAPIFVCKILFFAEKWHLNKFGRPIIADTYIAMPRGPVPSTVKNYIDQNFGWVEEPESLSEAVAIDKAKGWPRLMPGMRPPNMSLFSPSDIECLDAAIEFCRNKRADELSQITHFEKAWREADANRPMDYEKFIDDDNKHRDQILELARENATYGVL